MTDIEINGDETYEVQFLDQLGLRVDEDGDVRIQILENNLVADDVPTVYLTPEQAFEWAERLRLHGERAQEIREGMGW